MTTDNKDNKDNKEIKDLNKSARQVTEDARNTMIISGNRPKEASLDFDFDFKSEPEHKEYGLPDEYKEELYKELREEETPAAEPDPGDSKGMVSRDSFTIAKEKLRKKLEEKLRQQELKEQEANAILEEREAEAEYNEKLNAAVEKEMAAAKADGEFSKKVKEKAKIVKEKAKAKKAEFDVKRAEAAAKRAAAAEEAKKKAAEYEKAKAAAGGGDGSNKDAKPKTTAKEKGKKVVNKLTGSKDGKKRKFGWLIALLKIMFALIIVCGVVGGSYVAYTIANAEPIHPDKIYNDLEVSTHIYDDQGVLTDDIFLSENREIVTYDELPDNLKNAFIAIEDKTFWTHKGVNIKRIFGAIWNSVSGGGEISGTSTITQQLARNVFLPEEKSVRSIKRKIIEMYYAHEIEEMLSKEEILTAYLNTIYLGYGCYGIDTASQKYFDVPVEELSLEQCAALAALPQAPGVYALLLTENDEAETTTDIGDGLYANDVSQARRFLVLDLMAEQGYITAEEAEAAKKPLTDFIKPGGQTLKSISAFKDYLLDTVKKDLMTTYNIDEEQADKLIYTKGLNIYSTLDRQAQNAIAKQFKKDSNFPDAVDDKGKVDAAMVITEVGTGQIKAMVGTRNAEGEKLFNRAVSPRQPGSSIKPLSVYAPALQKSYEYQKEGKLFKFKDTGYDSQGKKYWGNYITAASGVKDEKMKVKGQTWPLNFSRTYSGYKTFRQALQLSLNTCAVKILAQVDVDYSMEMVKKFGISTAVDDTSQSYNDVNLAALGLGAMTEGATPLDMALAYATFPNGGVRNSGICYTKVTDHDGKVLLEGKSTETKVLDEGVAYIMTDLLQSVVTDGIAGNAYIKGENVGGKTGTTDDTWDIWFNGFTANYSAALWIGTDNNVPLNAQSSVAASLWSKVMKNVKRAKGGEYKSRPDNVIVKNGEYFTKGTQPPDPPKEEKKKDEKKDDKKTDGSTDANASTDKKESDKKDN